MTMNGYQLRRVSEPDAEPITLEQAKQQCRIDDDIVEDNDWLTDAISEAREFIEGYLQSSIMPTVWEIQASSFPWTYPSAIHLPMGPLIAVESFSYLDRDGVRQELAGPGAFRAVPNGTTGFLLPAFNTAWPPTRTEQGSLLIQYRAGYVDGGSPEAAQVPRAIARATKLLVAHWYENREAIITGTIAAETPLGFFDVIQPFRNYP